MPAQRVELFLRLDAFGQRLHAQALAELDDGAQDHVGLRARGQPGDEAAVDLERVDRVGAQVGQRGVAGAEVVQPQPDAQRAQRLHARARRGRVGEHGGLGHLQLQPEGRQPRLGEHLRDGAHQVPAGELHAGDVDGDLAVAAPAGGVTAGLAQHPLTQRHDQPGFFRHRDELRRRDPAPLRVAPAHQRLEAGQPAVGDVVLRLVVHAEPAAGQVRLGPVGVRQRPLRRGQRLTEFMDDEVALDHALAHRRVEQPHHVAAGGLGLVERDVGLLQQQRRRVPRPGPRRHAQAGAHLDAQVLRRPRLAQRGQHRQRQRLALDDVQGLRDQQRELVTAQPRQHAAARPLVHTALQPLRHLLQQPVADEVAEVVVDRLEVVQIEQVERQRAECLLVDRLGRLHQRGHGLLGARLQHMAVRQPGERVHVREPLQFARLLVQRRHIAHDTAPADLQTDLVQHRHPADRPPQRPAHGAAHLHLHLPERCLAGQAAHQPDEVGRHLAVRRVAEALLHGQRRPALAEAQQLQQRLAEQQLRRTTAEFAGHALGGMREAALAVGGPAPGTGLGLEIVQQQRGGFLAACSLGLRLLPGLAMPRQHEQSGHPAPRQGAHQRPEQKRRLRREHRHARHHQTRQQRRSPPRHSPPGRLGRTVRAVQRTGSA